MTTLVEKLKNDLIAARKEKDKEKVSLLSLLVAVVNDKSIALRENNVKITDEDVQKILLKHAKNLEDNIKTYEEKSFLEEAEREKKELEFINSYLPKQLSEEETIEAVKLAIKEVNASSVKDIGKVMGYLSKNHKNCIDLKLANSTFSNVIQNGS